MDPITTKEQWVKDSPRVRSFDNKRLRIEGKGVFLMHIRETDSKGNRNEGHVQLLLEPYDLDAAMNCVKAESEPGPIKTL